MTNFAAIKVRKTTNNLLYISSFWPFQGPNQVLAPEAKAQD